MTKNRKRKPDSAFANADSAIQVPTGQTIFSIVRSHTPSLSSRFFVDGRATWQTVIERILCFANRREILKKSTPLRRRRVFPEQRVDDGAEPRYVPDHVRGLRGARRRGRPRGVHPHRRAKRRADAPLRRLARSALRRKRRGGRVSGDASRATDARASIREKSLSTRERRGLRWETRVTCGTRLPDRRT